MTHDRPSSEWRSVSRAEPCPICGRPDWCRVLRSGTVVWCSRVTEAPSGWRRIKQGASGGHVFVAQDGRTRLVQRRRQSQTHDQPPTAEHCEHFEERAQGCVLRLTAALVRRVADRLDTTPAVLRSVGCGWDGKNLTTPMRLIVGNSLRTVGLATRAPDGAKRMHTGSRRGLFLAPQTITDAVLGAVALVPEGASDTFAALAAGVLAVGRTACCATAFERDTLRVLLRDFNTSIVADDDAPGQRGARELATHLASSWQRDVTILTPRSPHKDLRDLISSWHRLRFEPAGE
ncbi:MAG: toprim domain-containing protein [Planctomycetota bacterium]